LEPIFKAFGEAPSFRNPVFAGCSPKVFSDAAPVFEPLVVRQIVNSAAVSSNVSSEEQDTSIWTCSISLRTPVNARFTTECPTIARYSEVDQVRMPALSQSQD
jgi:hypothetical protein